MLRDARSPRGKISIKQLGVFDFDKTIIDILSGVELAGELEKMGKFSDYDKFIEGQERLKCEDRFEYESGLTYLSDLFAESIKEVTLMEIDEAVINLKKRANISPGFTELYNWLKDRNFRLVLVSSSPIECTKIIKDYPFDYYIAFEPCSEGRVYTGKHKGAMTSTRKIKELRPLLSGSSFSFGVGNYRDMEVFKDFDYKFIIEDDWNSDNSVIKIKKLSEVKTHLIKHLSYVKS